METDCLDANTYLIEEDEESEEEEQEEEEEEEEEEEGVEGKVEFIARNEEEDVEMAEVTSGTLTLLCILFLSRMRC